MSDERKVFNVWPLWDREVERLISQTDIWGLNVETATLEEFTEVVVDLAHEMIAANHADEIAGKLPVVVIHPPGELSDMIEDAA